MSAARREHRHQRAADLRHADLILESEPDLDRVVQVAFSVVEDVQFPLGESQCPERDEPGRIGDVAPIDDRSRCRECVGGRLVSGGQRRLGERQRFVAELEIARSATCDNIAGIRHALKCS